MCRFIHMEEGLAEWKRGSMEDEAELALKSFRGPRNLLLYIVASYFQHNVTRWRVLRRLLADSSLRTPDTLDHKTLSVSRSDHLHGRFLSVFRKQEWWNILRKTAVGYVVGYPLQWEPGMFRRNILCEIVQLWVWYKRKCSHWQFFSTSQGERQTGVCLSSLPPWIDAWM